MADERKFSIQSFSFKPKYSSDIQSESSSDEVQSAKDNSNRFSVTGHSMRNARRPLKEIACVCCREVTNVAGRTPELLNAYDQRVCCKSIIYP